MLITGKISEESPIFLPMTAMLYAKTGCQIISLQNIMKAALTKQVALTVMAGKNKNITLYSTKLRNAQIFSKTINCKTVCPILVTKLNKGNALEELNALFFTVIKIREMQNRNFRFWIDQTFNTTKF
jgi:hypothetical protein